MLRVVAYGCRCEKSEIPILGHVPIEGVEGIEEDEE